MRSAPLLQASCAPGAMQQQLPSLLFSVQKRVQGEIADHASTMVNGCGLAVWYLRAASMHEQSLRTADTPADADVTAASAGASTVAQLVVLLGHSLMYLGSRMQHLLQQAEVYVHATAERGGRSSKTGGGRQRMADDSTWALEEDLMDCLHQVAMCTGSAVRQLQRHSLQASTSLHRPTKRVHVAASLPWTSWWGWCARSRSINNSRTQNSSSSLRKWSCHPRCCLRRESCIWRCLRPPMQSPQQPS